MAKVGTNDYKSSLLLGDAFSFILKILGIKSNEWISCPSVIGNYIWDSILKKVNTIKSIKNTHIETVYFMYDGDNTPQYGLKEIATNASSAHTVTSLEKLKQKLREIVSTYLGNYTENKYTDKDGEITLGTGYIVSSVEISGVGTKSSEELINNNILSSNKKTINLYKLQEYLAVGISDKEIKINMKKQ